MVDWIFYDEMARDLMRDCFIYSGNPKKISDKEIKRFAKDRNLNIKNLKVSYEDIKHRFDPKDDFE